MLTISETTAAILVRSRAELVVDTISLPSHLSSGQVLVKVEYSGVCATQLHEIDATNGPDRYLPHLLGHEGSGVVMEVGPGVSTVAPGDEVVLHWRPGAGLGSETPAYRWRKQRLNAGWVTTFNSHAVVSENRVTRIPSGLDMRRMPMFGCAITTGFGAAGNDAKLKAGESAVVVGVGGVGLAAIHAAHLATAYPIVAVDVHPAQLDAARILGATHSVLLSGETDPESQILTIVGVDGADAVIEAAGVGRAIDLAYRVCGARGRIVLVGVPDPSEAVTIDTYPLHFGKSLVGSNGGGAVPDREIPRLARLCEIGRLQLGDFPICVHSLNDINVALDLVRSGMVGRQIIQMP